ncbi:MAG: hypothetical protein M3O64_02585 [Chloroflexota bacterium]|nr:hypothetical protein [Chloroflexota bacterium]
MRPTRFATEIGWLLQTGLIVFIATPTIGILNGTKVLGELSRDVILTHVHSGTLGWITLGAMAMVLWLFGPAVPASKDRNTRTLALLSAGTIPLYVLAFFSGNLPARAITGTLLLLVILMWAVFAIGAASGVGWKNLSVAQLAAVLALVSLVIGSTLGVLIQIQLATGAKIFTNDATGAHATAQVSGYLVLMSVGLIDWRILGERSRRTLAANVMIGALFLGGLCVAGGLLLGLLPLTGLATPLEILAVVILLVRVGPSALRTPFGSGSARFFAIAVPFLVTNIVLTVYLIITIVSSGKPFDQIDIPFNLIIALDHAIFVGTMTNILFGVLSQLTADRARVWPWADQVIFWFLNIGVAVFIVVLLAKATELERFTAPAMGLAVYLGIATYSLRLRTRPEPQPAAMPA